MDKSLYQEGEGRWPAFVAAVFLGFVLVFLNVVIDPRAMDISLIPRLLTLQVVLFFAVAALVWSGMARAIDLTILRDPVVVCFALYSLWTALSLLSAANVSAGWTEVFKTFATFTVLCLGCLILPLLPSWPVWIARLAVSASLLSLAAGAYDYLHLPVPWQHDRANMERVMGLMSNVNLYASFLLLLLPLCLVAVAILRGAWRWVAVLAAVLLLGAVGILQTRAVYLGLGAGFLVAFCTVAAFHRSLGLPPWSKTLAVTAVVFLMGAIAVFAVAAHEANPVAERLRSILADRSKNAGGGRPAVWLMTLEMARDHPLTGVGAGNFAVRLHDYFDVDDPEFSHLHPNWLQPHNDFLWVLAEKGLPGLISFAGIFVFAGTGLVGALRRGLSPPGSWMAVGSLAALGGYAVVSFLDFPLERINHQVYFALYLSLAVVLKREVAGLPPRRVADFSSLIMMRIVAIFFLLVLAAGMAYGTAALRQERFMVKARLAMNDEDWPAVVRNARLARTAWKDLDAFATPVSFIEGLGLMFSADHVEALQCLEEARRQLPSRLYIVNNLAVLYSLTRQSDRALQYFQAVVERSPKSIEARYRLGLGYLKAGESRRSLEILRQIPDELATPEMRTALRQAQEAVKTSPGFEEAAATQSPP
jgi:O-antigen ligase